MINIRSTKKGTYTHYINHCLFHPTDAVEDAWGRRILDAMAADGGIGMIRIYNMFEDIVYTDEDGNLCYDFRLNDLRLDYLIECGFDILIAYACTPECISARSGIGSSVSKNATRYKGKMFNTSPPRSEELWEEICYQYTKHIVERYGIERVSKWMLQCYNEPDIPAFFIGDLPQTPENEAIRLDEYCKMYKAFEHGIMRVSDKLCMGGPAIASSCTFLDSFLKFVKENSLRLDYIAVHCYGTGVRTINNGEKPIRVSNITTRYDRYCETIRQNGFEATPLVFDEWGAAAQGFFNVEECPPFMMRENEKLSAFFVRMLYELVEKDANIAKMMFCLSGQHEMTTDFSGFRNFFTLNFIRKPIYNAHILSSMLGDDILDSSRDNENVCTIPTKRADGSFAVLTAYADDDISETLPERREVIRFDEPIAGKKATVYRIDKDHTNPYRMAERLGITTPDKKELEMLRAEGKLKPITEFVCQNNEIEVELSANAVVMLIIE